MNAYFKSNNHSLTFSPISHAPSYTNASLMDFIFPRKYTVPIPVAISEVLFLHLHPLQNFSINTRNSFSTKIFEYSRDSKSRIRKLENRSSGTWKSSFLCLISVCSLSNLFFRFHTTTLTEACSNELKQHHL